MSSDRLLSPYETAAELIHALTGFGVRHAVISPGSRSTPLTLACAHHQKIKSTVVLDERSAAFIALGIGKQTGVPAILVCTSGTAAANYFPAVAEARASGVPIVVLTADRPPNLRGIGSSQTIDQIKLFGDHTVLFHELGEPVNQSWDIDRIRFSARQAISDAVTKGGAAHINVPFRKPLEPEENELKRAENLFRSENENSFNQKADLTKSVILGNEITDRIKHAENPLIIAGPSNAFQSPEKLAFRFAEQFIGPIIAEPGSQLGEHPLRVHRYEQFLRNPATRQKLKPDLILRFGDQPFTKSVLTALEDWKDVDTIRFDYRNSWQDHQMSSDLVVNLSPGETIDLEIFDQTTSYKLTVWKDADQEAGEILHSFLEKENRLTDGHIFSRFIHDSNEGNSIMLSNSLPPRDAALFGEPGQHVTVNRGAAGIDGILSTAIGTAIASGKPTTCLTGDLAFLHDSNALLTLQKSETPFTVIVVNNKGGNIFRMLPVYDQKKTYTDFFETPQNVNIEDIAKAHNIIYQRVENRQQLEETGLSSVKNPGVRIIECITDPDASMSMRKELWGS
ncbi:2-succinyl-5-enolpyruvyl-6-hydroxy-3-cyclohexene-1-carboxylic-acid synthase [Rhodohalobacter sp. SW132]|uniref:2-succinyl-5-enolpyruvyl-6-hydroxy-3- cyclohexene-1-carboxylic-acid synthase n=1 Tax=Rhodohalobacter sp. SW132 TaxID=2293433 RepID=UPI000E22D9EE|nr:2-succinyl-5-enolpyruvyl-6-hydroxy-3-cyclohexene-1-carboxylic-acid synthase [Rhodohalobacter sp. SW132]REL24093.1 2-succinyl-5-enolpyruvyl-6-hydroxy-3-cyclohexene-1-carboxylic-acid synthase [Rhodohalobacter sp. SW132]